MKGLNDVLTFEPFPPPRPRTIRTCACAVVLIMASNKSVNLIVIGPPGAGKGTVVGSMCLSFMKILHCINYFEQSFFVHDILNLLTDDYTLFNRPQNSKLTME